MERLTERFDKFTFHYASTLSGQIYPVAIVIADLHSTMLLLYRVIVTSKSYENPIYIPLCFYFIQHRGVLKLHSRLIYIPLCFYFILYVGNNTIMGHGFTFHYASTLSLDADGHPIKERRFTFHYASTLSQQCLMFHKELKSIYIPLCFYFIS